MRIIDAEKNLVSAYFSVIGPRKMLMPHEGPWCGVLRIHLGIEVPMRPLPWPLNWLNHFVVYMARFIPYFKEPVKRHKEWEKTFYKDAA